MHDDNRTQAIEDGKGQKEHVERHRCAFADQGEDAQRKGNICRRWDRSAFDFVFGKNQLREG